LHGLQTPGGADPLTGGEDLRTSAGNPPSGAEEGKTPSWNRGTYGRVLLTATVVVVLDQLTKWWALEALADGPVDIIEGAITLRLGFNSGGAFGLFQGLPGIFLLTTVVVIGIILFWIRKLDDPRWLVPLGMVLGGGLGNLADRLFRDLDGQVIDFIDLHVWPIFNLADAAIVIGVGLVILLGWRPRRDAGGRDPAPGG
jgi:signal peptidase II